MDEFEVTLPDRPGRQTGLPQPVDQPAPERGAQEHDREAADLVRLHQGERLEELVKGAEPTWQDDEALRRLDEHRLADEEVAEVPAEVDVLVHPRLERQLDPEADGEP